MALMTSHLESTAEYSAERVRQLRVALKDMTNAPPDATVVFGGDMNLRDKEVSKSERSQRNFWLACKTQICAEIAKRVSQ